MKLKGTIIALVLGAVVFTGCENADTSSKEVVLTTKQDTISYFLGMLSGEQIKSQLNEGFQFTEINHDLVNAGIDAGFKGDSAALITKEEGGAIAQAYYQEIQDAQMKEKYGDAQANNEKFLTNLETKEGVTATGTGLLYEVVELGNGATPTVTDLVTVHYTGKLIDNSVFDSSVERGEPAKFALNQVIPGWTEGIQLMPLGSKFTFYIPYYLAYGEQGRGETIPPYATLIFEVELLKIGE